MYLLNPWFCTEKVAHKKLTAIKHTDFTSLTWMFINNTY